MQLYRKSDTWTYIVFRGFVVSICYLWLAYFAVVKILDVRDQKFILQSIIVYATPENPFIPYPDIIICVPGGMIQFENMTSFDMRSMSSPYCARTEGSIISAKNHVLHANESFVMIGITPPHFEASTFAMFLLSDSNNPWRGTQEPSEEELSQVYFIQEHGENIYPISTAGSGLLVRMVSHKIWGIREGWMGYFGALQETPRYMVSTTANDFTPAIPGSIELLFNTPPYWQEQKQVPITTIPSAFASVGGAFSAICAILRIIFGAPRIDPFGIFTSCCRRRKTRANFAREFPSWKNAGPVVGSKSDDDELSLIERDKSNTGTALLAPTEERVERVENQVRELALILREYYLDMELTQLGGKIE